MPKAKTRKKSKKRPKSAVPKELFTLNPIVEDPRFEGFAMRKAPSLLGHDTLFDDLVAGYGLAENDPNWKQPRLAKKWRAPKVVGRVGAYNDYPTVDQHPAFSARACEVLAPFLEGNGELLPVQSTLPVDHFIFNVTTISDALDQKRSDCEFWCDPPTTTEWIEYFAFHKTKLKGLSIFRLREWPMEAIVTDAFVECVEENGLNGFEFVKIWPLKPGQDWEMASPRKPKNQKKPTRDIKKESLVILFALSKAKPNATEKKTLRKLEDDLDAQLMVPSVTAPYFGSYEGHDITDDTYRMFLSAPDVDALGRKLGPWLASIGWKRPLRAVKRYGEMRDVDVKEVDIELA